MAELTSSSERSLGDDASATGTVQLEHLGKVETGADDRTDDRDPLEDGLEHRQRELVVRRQSDQDEASVAAQRVERLAQRLGVGGGHDRDVHASERLELGRRRARSPR